MLQLDRMPTYAQIAANRRNSLNSTGPRTEPGKTAASRNATRHGLTSDFVLNTVEDADEFQASLERIRAEFQPQTDHENFLVQQMAQARWKLARAQRLENAAFEMLFQQGFDKGDGQSYETCVVSSMNKSGGNALALMQRYAAAAERSYYKAHRELQQGRKDAKVVEKQVVAAMNRHIEAYMNAPMPDAAPAQIGFVSQFPAPAPSDAGAAT